LSFRGIPYDHFGVDLGEGMVMHFGSDGDLAGGEAIGRQFAIRRVSMETFAQGCPVAVAASDEATSFSLEVVASRAEWLEGKTGYDLRTSNCEHFATWCRTGRWESQQVQSVEESVRVAVRVAAKASVPIAARLGQTWAIGPRALSTSGLGRLTGWLPVSLLGDAVDWAAVRLARQQGCSGSQSRMVGMVSGCAVAGVVGCIVAGPAAATALVGLHLASTCLWPTPAPGQPPGVQPADRLIASS
jgi:hypothetical protein